MNYWELLPLDVLRLTLYSSNYEETLKLKEQDERAKKIMKEPGFWEHKAKHKYGAQVKSRLGYLNLEVKKLEEQAAQQRDYKSNEKFIALDEEEQELNKRIKAIKEKKKAIVFDCLKAASETIKIAVNTTKHHPTHPKCHQLSMPKFSPELLTFINNENYNHKLMKERFKIVFPELHENDVLVITTDLRLYICFARKEDQNIKLECAANSLHCKVMRMPPSLSQFALLNHYGSETLALYYGFPFVVALAVNDLPIYDNILYDI